MPVLPPYPRPFTSRKIRVPVNSYETMAEHDFEPVDNETRGGPLSARDSPNT
jgi:hypothetical protein